MSFQIVEQVLNTNKKYRFTRSSLCFKLNAIPEEVSDAEKWLKECIMEIVAHVVQDVDSEDRVSFAFGSECFSKGNAYLAFRKAKTLKFDDVWQLLGKIYQSNSRAFHSNTFRVTMTLVKPFRGTGRTSNYNTYEEECANRRGIVVVNNTDNLCLPRALVVARAYAMKSPFTEQIRRNKCKMQDIETIKLLQEASLQIPKDGAGSEELKKFQQHLKEFKITVYSYGTKGRGVLFEGSEAPLKINLLHHNSHFNVITNLKAVFRCNFYCESCHTPYDHKNAHRCIASCPCCQQIPPCKKTRGEITCEDCHRKFRGQGCYDKHIAPDSYGNVTVCAYVKRCPECLKTILANRLHTCGEVFCKMCNKHQSVGHYCYMQPNNRNPPSEGVIFIFYDLECTQDKRGPNGEKIHVPNLCVFQQRCDVCIDQDNDVLICNKCGVRRQVLKNSPIETFMEHVLGIKKRFKRIVVMAHNGKAYDHQFILRHVLEKTDLKVDLIMRGSSIIMMGVDRITFLDSINYFPMALAALPKAFDLGPEIKKGFFPHYFNTLENIGYDGPLPSIKYYDSDSMKEDARIQFLEWYETHKNDNFNMQRDLVEYCISDVDILTKACIKFRKMFLNECNVCPFTESVTIASACNLVFRRNFLRPMTIGVIPKKGYRNGDNQSKIATLWLIYEESQRGIKIIHSAKQREVVVAGVKVDGYAPLEGSVDSNHPKGLIFEMHGCHFHGHTCITTKRDDPLHEDPSDTLNTRYERTIKKTQRLKEMGYEVIEMWECNFRDMLQKNRSLKQELEDHPLYALTPLDPRDAFYGGRTGNCKTYYQCKPGEKIKYVDVCSLYPWVTKYGKFPVKHPRVYVGEDCKQLDLTHTDGLIKCKILPPQQLYHPILPTKMNNKLMFVLCRTCGTTMQQEECNHSIDQRALTGTWVIDEIQKALENGYTMLKVYEVWQYDIEQYNSSKKLGGLFTEMMNKFIKLKQQATGFPGNCVTQEQKDAFIEKFFENEGIRMEFVDIVRNPGLRSLAKLMLNSFWGKFGQRENQAKTAIIRQPYELEELLANPSLDVNHIEEVNEDTLIVCYEYKDEAADVLGTVNVCVAAYTTAQARLKLYSYLEKLGDRVLYYDTDSVIYVSREGEWDVPTGSCLGEMTDELEEYGPESYIVVFSSGGPKNYSYILFSPKFHTYYTVCKVKGICLNYSSSRILNFHSMKEMVTSEVSSEPLYITSRNIRRSRQHHVITKEETKIYRPRSEKRKFGEHFDSVPYGYKKRWVQGGVTNI